jgi:hypothetical protein
VGQHSRSPAAGMEVHRKELVVDNHRDSVVGHRVERRMDPAVDLVEEDHTGLVVAHKDPEEEAHRGLVVDCMAPGEERHKVGYHNLSWGLDLDHKT